MKSFLLLPLILVLLSFKHSYGKPSLGPPYECDFDSIPQNSAFTLNPECTQSTLFYIPDEYTSHKTIKVAIHFMQRATGTPLNFTDLDDGLGNTNFTGHDFANLVIFYANSQLDGNYQMNLPQGNSTPVLERKYNYVLKDVLFHASDADYTYGGTNGSTLNSTYGSPDVLDLFLLYDETMEAGGGNSTPFAGWVRQRGTW